MGLLYAWLLPDGGLSKDRPNLSPSPAYLDDVSRSASGPGLAICLGQGFDTVCVDSDPQRVDQLSCGVAVLDEPQLDDLLRTGLDRDALRFTSDYRAVAGCDVVFVCVPTPTGADGSADLLAVESCVDRLVEVLLPGSVVAVKSTVPVGTCQRLSQRLTDRDIGIVSNPEFLREGYAVYDFCHPDRV